MGAEQITLDGWQSVGLDRMLSQHPWGVRRAKRVAARVPVQRVIASPLRPQTVAGASIVASSVAIPQPRAAVVRYAAYRGVLDDFAADAAESIDQDMDSIWNGWQVCFAAALVAAAVTWLCASPVIEVGMY